MAVLSTSKRERLADSDILQTVVINSVMVSYDLVIPVRCKFVDKFI